MKSLKELYKIGPGPSSSHTLAPYRACKLFIENHENIDHVVVNLYGSLSLTGKGHFTDYIIKKTFNDIKCDIIFEKDDWKESFCNGFYLSAYDKDNNLIDKWTIFSIGGGSIEILEYEVSSNVVLYKETNMNEILKYCVDNNCSIYDYVKHYENDIDDYLNLVLSAMLDCVERGLNTKGLLPGKLCVERSAKSLYLKAKTIDDDNEKIKLLQMAYAYAASEENACLQQVVTAPTLGASGVLAAIMYHSYFDLKISRKKLVEALAVGGIFGNIVKRNATISGAVGGCQAEIGVACAMGAACISYLNDMNNSQIEYAAEIAIEHHLGLTCDPVGGYVIIPCIERNGVATLRSYDSMLLAKYMSNIKKNIVSFDIVVKTMSYTGKKIAIELKETSLGGLASDVVISV